MNVAASEQHVGTLDAGRNLLEQLLEHRDRPLPVAGETVKVAGRSRRCRARAGSAGVNVGGKLAELGRSSGRPTVCCLVGGGVEVEATAASGPSAASARWRARSSTS